MEGAGEPNRGEDDTLGNGNSPGLEGEIFGIAAELIGIKGVGRRPPRSPEALGVLDGVGSRPPRRPPDPDTIAPDDEGSRPPRRPPEEVGNRPPRRPPEVGRRPPRRPPDGVGEAATAELGEPAGDDGDAFGEVGDGVAVALLLLSPVRPESRLGIEMVGRMSRPSEVEAEAVGVTDGLAITLEAPTTTPEGEAVAVVVGPAWRGIRPVEPSRAPPRPSSSPELLVLEGDVVGWTTTEGMPPVVPTPAEVA